MLLETLDIRKKDVLIFSQNKFDFSENFRIVNKSNRVKRPQKIGYFEVCEIVKEPIPKNLIVYRLLTNVQDLDAYSTKYGYFIKINGTPELIYFDPVFAIKDIRHLRFDFDPSLFRFKIQQLGLTSSGVQKSEANYEEVFGFDLKAAEAQALNDKIFADAIFAFDDTYIDEDEFSEKEIYREKKISPEITRDMESHRLTDIAEIRQTSKDELSKAHFEEEDESATSKVREEKVNMLKKALGIEKTSAPGRIEPEPGESGFDEEGSSQSQSLFDLFKTTDKFSDMENRKNQSFILKINDKS